MKTIVLFVLPTLFGVGAALAANPLVACALAVVAAAFAVASVFASEGRRVASPVESVPGWRMAERLDASPSVTSSTISFD